MNSINSRKPRGYWPNLFESKKEEIVKRYSDGDSIRKLIKDIGCLNSKKEFKDWIKKNTNLKLRTKEERNALAKERYDKIAKNKPPKKPKVYQYLLRLSKKVKQENPKIIKIPLWSAEEDEIIKENYSKLSKKELCCLFPDKSWGQIMSRGKFFNKSRSHFCGQKRKTYDPKYYRISGHGYKLIMRETPDLSRDGYFRYYGFEHVKVVEESIGRKVNLGEEVHHINGEKLDNRIENLYLCWHKEHSLLHSSLQRILYAFYKSGHIIFDKIYKLNEKTLDKTNFDSQKILIERNLGSGYKLINGVREHRLVVESNIGRKLRTNKDGTGEGIHHLDGDKLNNSVQNLHPYLNEEEHGLIHSSLKSIWPELFNMGFITFLRDKGSYAIKDFLEK